MAPAMQVLVPIRAVSAAVGATSAMRRRPTGGWVDHPIGSQLGALGALRPGLFDRLGDMRFSEVFVADLCQKNILLGCRPPDEADAGLSGAAKRGPGSGTSCPGRAGRIVRPRRPPNRRSLRCARRAWSWPSRSPRQCQVLSSSAADFPRRFGAVAGNGRIPQSSRILPPHLSDREPAPPTRGRCSSDYRWRRRSRDPGRG